MVVYRKNLLAEALCLFVCVMALIWTSQWNRWVTIGLSGVAGFAVLTSWRWRGDTVSDIGLCVTYADVAKIPLGIVWMLIALSGVLVIGHAITPRFWDDPVVMKKLSTVSLGYMLGIPFQEGLLHGYFTNRIGKVFPGRHHLCAAIVGSMFALVHLPNPVLAIATFVFAGGGAYFFLAKSRNLYFFCFAHLILSTAVKCLIAVPLVGHGSMRIGPGFWQ